MQMWHNTVQSSTKFLDDWTGNGERNDRGTVWRYPSVKGNKINLLAFSNILLNQLGQFAVVHHLLDDI
jgi:hypothetical protein